jgi:hypothetical protein
VLYWSHPKKQPILRADERINPGVIASQLDISVDGFDALWLGSMECHKGDHRVVL